MSFILSAPTSGSGKTTVTLGLLAALRRRGLRIRGAKSGPDYIDPMFHAAATGQPCVNLDAWAMQPEQIRSLAQGTGKLIVEGAMGLFDGAPPDGGGSTADLARILKLPVVLVVNSASMSHSVAALVQGFAKHDASVKIAGVILNNVGSERHERMLRAAIDTTGLPVFGALRRSDALARPSRHLGLVQAGEMPDLDAFLENAAMQIERSLDLDALCALGPDPASPTHNAAPSPLTAPRRIALARDAAFGFSYAHHVMELQKRGHQITYFSPLADDIVPEADSVFLPGGYPELHADRLAGATHFLSSLREAAQSVPVTGECGGYMVLGEVLTDANGTEHKMAGLLPLHTTFKERKLSLGYRTLRDRLTGADGLKAHEFHYATTLRADGTALFDAEDAEGNSLGEIGLREGNVSGSFAHIIEPHDGALRLTP